MDKLLNIAIDDVAILDLKITEIDSLEKNEYFLQSNVENIFLYTNR